MSLIEEALRRVQDPSISKASASGAPRGKSAPPGGAPDAESVHPWPTSPAGEPAKSSMNPLLTVAVAVLSLTGVILLGGAFWMGRTITRTEERVAGMDPAAERPAPSAESLRPSAAPGLPTADARRPGTLEAAVTAQRPAPNAEKPVANIPLIALPWAKATPPANDQELRVTGVVEGMGEPYAVINGMIIGEGEQVGGATLLNISNGSVRLRLADGTETVEPVSP